MGQKKFSSKVSGTIYPKSKSLEKRWFFYWWTLSEDGKQQKTRHFIPSEPTVAAREAAAKGIIADIVANGVPKPPSKIVKPEKLATVQLQHVHQRLLDKKNNLRTSSFQKYRSEIRAFDKYCVSNKIKYVTSDTAEQFLLHLVDRGLSGATINHYRNTLSGHYSDVVKRKKLPSNPFTNTDRQKVNSSGAEYFRTAQIVKLKSYLIEHLPEVWLCAQFQYYCFLRPNAEFRLITVSDINLETWQIRVRSDVGKNNRAAHVVIPLPLRAQITAMNLPQYPETHYICGKHGRPSATPVGKNYFTRKHRDALNALKLHGHSLYSWKHTGVVAAYQSGIKLEDLRRQLRHSSLDMVMIYLRSLGLIEMDDLANSFPEI